MMAPAKKKDKKRTAEASARTWREIKQAGPRKSLSVAARKRKTVALLKTSGSILGLILILGGVTWLGLTWYQSPEYKVGRSEGPPIRQLHLETNGVLTRDWVDLILDIPPDAGLTEVSIFELKEKLEGHSQVASAVVGRRFPDTLHVQLKERVPVSRIAVAREFGGHQTYLVSPGGVVYEGHEYDPDFLRTLPYLDGVRLRRNAEGAIQALEGMPQVARFLELARNRYPRLYYDWRILGLENLNGPAPGIQVRGRRHPSARFALNGFERQLEQLNHVLKDLPGRIEERQQGQIDMIDLSLDGPVVVTFHQR